MKTFFLFLFALSLVSCKEEASHTKVKDGAAEVVGWYKSPDVIARTMKGLLCSPEEIDDCAQEDTISLEDKLTYFSKLGILYGNRDTRTNEASLERPDSAYVLALDILSHWFSGRLIEKQLRLDYTKNEDPFMFQGGPNTLKGMMATDRENCFGNDEAAWCDKDDLVTLGSYSKNNLPASIEQRKRVMHNIQDIGSFLGALADNQLQTDGYDHIPHYLLDEVFIPKLANTYADNDCLGLIQRFTETEKNIEKTKKSILNLISEYKTEKSSLEQQLLEEIDEEKQQEIDYRIDQLEYEIPELERNIIDLDNILSELRASINRIEDYSDICAWKEVVYTILMSGQFYMDIPSRLNQE